MSVVRRRKEAIDALEHALQGVHTYGPQAGESQRFDSSNIIGQSSARPGQMHDDTPVEHDVTVVMPALPQSKPRR